MYINNNEGNKHNESINGALMLAISTVIVKVIGVIYKVPISYILGDEGMGYFNSAYTIYGFFYIICSTGIPKAITMLVSNYNGKGQEQYSLFVYKYALKIFAIFGVIITALFIFFSDQISLAIGNNKAVFSMLSIAPSIFFVTISGVARGFLNGCLRFLPIAVSSVIEAVSKLVLGLGFGYLGAILGYSLPMIASFSVLGITLGSFFSLLYLYIMAKKSEKGHILEQRTFVNKIEILKGIVKIAVPITLSSSVLSISNLFDLTLIMNGLKQVNVSEEIASALYGNYTTLVIPMLNLVSSVLAPVSVAILPKLVSSYANKNRREFTNLYENSFLLTLCAGIPCTIIFALYSFDILDVLFMSYSSYIASDLLIAISPSMIFLPLLTLQNTALESKGKIKHSVFSMCIGCVLKILISFILITKIGIIAAPIGTTLSYILSFVISSIFLNEKIKVFDVIKVFVISTISFVLPYLIIFREGIFGSGFIAVFVSVVISSMIYLLGLLLFFRKNTCFYCNNAQKSEKPLRY